MNRYLTLALALGGAFALGTLAVSFGNARHSTETAAQEAPPHTHHEAEQSPTTEKTARTPVFSEAEAEDIRAIVYDYLIDNPEVLVEAIGVYQERQELAKFDNARSNLNALLDEENGYVTALNRKNASVAVIELFDYHCGFCKQASGLVQQIANNDADVVIAFREFPILRQESEYAAEVALAAREQNKYLDFHFAMMNASGTLTKDRIFEIAKSENIDIRKLQKDAEKPAISAALQQTFQIAEEIGASGTPAFVVASLNGEYLDIISGYKPEAVMEAIAQAKVASSTR